MWLSDLLSILYIQLHLNLFLGILKNIEEQEDVVFPPIDGDLLGAAVSVVRLTEAYNLSIAHLARGKLQGHFWSATEKGELLNIYRVMTQLPLGCI